MASQTKAERQWWPLNEARPVAGSIRTGTGAVGDVELLCIPKYGGKQSHLFGNTVRVDLLSHGISATGGESMTTETIPGGEIVGPAPIFVASKVLASNSPEDITVKQVRDYLAENPEAKIVVVSIDWIKSQVRAAPWYDLRGELEQRGRELHFASGILLWEAWFATKPAGHVRSNGVTGQKVSTGALSLQ